MVKLDIEEKEREILFDLINSGAVQHIDHIMIDWHGSLVLPWSEDYYDGILPVASGGDEIAKFLRDALKTFYKMKADKFKYRRRTIIDETDDESFGYFNGTLPTC